MGNRKIARIVRVLSVKASRKQPKRRRRRGILASVYEGLLLAVVRGWGCFSPHNPKVEGSNPSPTSRNLSLRNTLGWKLPFVFCPLSVRVSYTLPHEAFFMTLSRCIAACCSAVRLSRPQSLALIAFIVDVLAVEHGTGFVPRNAHGNWSPALRPAPCRAATVRRKSVENSATSTPGSSRVHSREQTAHLCSASTLPSHVGQTHPTWLRHDAGTQPLAYPCESLRPGPRCDGISGNRQCDGKVRLADLAGRASALV